MPKGFPAAPTADSTSLLPQLLASVQAEISTLEEQLTERRAQYHKLEEHGATVIELIGPIQRLIHKAKQAAAITNGNGNGTSPFPSEGTRYDQIAHVVATHGQPIRTAAIIEGLRAHGIKLNRAGISPMISKATKRGLIKNVGRGFYASAAATGVSAAPVTEEKGKEAKQPSLHHVIHSVLTQHKQGLSREDLWKQVQAAGFRSKSKSPKNVFTTCLSQMRRQKLTREKDGVVTWKEKD